MSSASCHSGRMQPPVRLRPPPSAQGINPGVGKNSLIPPRCSSNKHSLDLGCFTGENQLEGFGGTGENKGTAISNGAPSHHLAQLQEVSGRLRQLRSPSTRSAAQEAAVGPSETQPGCQTRGGGWSSRTSPPSLHPRFHTDAFPSHHHKHRSFYR